MAEVVKTFTRKSTSEILEIGGSAYWRLKQVRAAQCQYVVCVRNRLTKGSAPGAGHGTAFLIGRICGVVGSGGRFIVQFDKYAELNLPNAWVGSRNPVAYTTLEALNINVNALRWLNVPKVGVEEVKPVIAPLTIPQAKLGLAKALGITPDSIEIIIRS